MLYNFRPLQNEGKGITDEVNNKQEKGTKDRKKERNKERKKEEERKKECGKARAIILQ
jgi:Skp family chaperone for outer membrane proteins